MSKFLITYFDNFQNSETRIQWHLQTNDVLLQALQINNNQYDEFEAELNQGILDGFEGLDVLQPNFDVTTFIDQFDVNSLIEVQKYLHVISQN